MAIMPLKFSSDKKLHDNNTCNNYKECDYYKEVLNKDDFIRCKELEYKGSQGLVFAIILLIIFMILMNRSGR